MVLTKTASLLVKHRTSIRSSGRLLDRFPLVTHQCLFRVCNREAQKDTHRRTRKAGVFPSSVLGGWQDKQHAVMQSSWLHTIQQTDTKVCIDDIIHWRRPCNVSFSSAVGTVVYATGWALLVGQIRPKNPRWKSSATVVTFDSDAFKGNIYLVEGVQSVWRLDIMRGQVWRDARI